MNKCKGSVGVVVYSKQKKQLYHLFLINTKKTITKKFTKKTIIPLIFSIGLKVKDLMIQLVEKFIN